MILSGKIDVSGNKQCGIVVMKDNASSNNPNLDTRNAELINTTEEFFKPTILAENSDQYVNTLLNKIPNINETQTHYYLNSTVKSKWTQIDNFVTKEEMILVVLGVF